MHGGLPCIRVREGMRSGRTDCHRHLHRKLTEICQPRPITCIPSCSAAAAAAAAAVFLWVLHHMWSPRPKSQAGIRASAPPRPTHLINEASWLSFIVFPQTPSSHHSAPASTTLFYPWALPHFSAPKKKLRSSTRPPKDPSTFHDCVKHIRHPRPLSSWFPCPYNHLQHVSILKLD